MRSILILDDDTELAELMVQLLELEGYEAVAVTNSGEAVEAVERLIPMCVIVDYELKDGSGIDFARGMRALYGQSMVLIAVSGWSENTTQALDLASVCDASFNKPLDWERFLDEIKILLDKA